MLFDIILSAFVDAEIAQLVEQRTEHPRVGSSILPLGILPFFLELDMLVFRRCSSGARATDS